MGVKEIGTYNIKWGPTKDRIFDACKYYGSVIIPIRFECEGVQLSDVSITDIGHENGSGHSLNLYGSCHALINSQDQTYRFKAWYNAKERSGRITFYGM